MQGKMRYVDIIFYFRSTPDRDPLNKSCLNSKRTKCLVETICSAISAGTEMLIYQGRFPRTLETDSVISGLRGGFKYPLAYGYACVGKVVEVGKDGE